MSHAAAVIERMFRKESGAVLATLIRQTGNFQLAEDAMQDALAAALSRWPVEGVPERPAAWIITTARRKAIDRARREQAQVRRKAALATTALLDAEERELEEAPAVPDDQLRLIFTCCHPALALDAQIALTLRTLGGLSTPEIARAFLVPEPTMAQRLVRAKKKIEQARIPYVVPEAEALPERVEAVLAVLYLIFNEGYWASSGDDLVRRDLCREAIRMARLSTDLMPDEPEVRGLLALMLLHDARSAARAFDDGSLAILEEQDRSRWDRQQIVLGVAEIDRALAMRRPGPYQIQAAIAALHAEAATAAETDWRQIAGLYRALIDRQPTPVVRINHAVAVAMWQGPEVGLALLEPIAAEVERYLAYHAARADLLRRLGKRGDALLAYERAIELADNGAVKMYLERRREEMRSPG